MLPFSPPPWDGERVTLSHGTLETAVPSILSEVDLRFAQANLNFGRGFHTTTLLRQAISWGHRLARRSGGVQRPAVVAFDVRVDELVRLDVLAFVRGESKPTGSAASCGIVVLGEQRTAASQTTGGIIPWRARWPRIGGSVR